VADATSSPLPLAVQLYTFRDPARFGEPGLGLDIPTLTSIAEAGFLGVETVGVPGGDPAAARRALDDLGLAVTSSHAWTDAADHEAIAAAAASVAELGSPRLILTPRPPVGSAEEIDAFADRLGEAAAIAARYGSRLGYHNHDTELRIVDGSTVLDRIAARVGDAIDFQIDIFWVVVAGDDPAAVIDRLGGRVVSLHVKDGVDLPSSAYSGEPFVNVAVGDGIVDPAPSIRAAAPSAEWLIVEFDGIDGPAIDGARRSLEYLTSRELGRGRRQ
jgi:sugar phosphate isomerase/epimerase